MRDKVLLVGAPEALARGFGPLPPNAVGAASAATGKAPVGAASAATREAPVGAASAATSLGTQLWLRPDQRLLVLDDAVEREQLDRPGVAVLEAGARFVEMVVAGPTAADRLASGCSLDFRIRAFPVGTCAQSRIEQVPVILHREALDRFTVYVERPLARYLQAWLDEAQKQSGWEESP